MSGSDKSLNISIDTLLSAVNEFRPEHAPVRKQSGDESADKYRRTFDVANNVARFGGTAATAATIRSAARHTDRHPSTAAKDAGNFHKGKFWWHGYEVSIENPKGSIRSGVNRDGKGWRVTMPAHYGYLRRTKSEADGDHLDVYIGPNIDSELVFVIDQQTPGRRFDEHKVVIGCDSLDEAKQLYLDAYSPDWQGIQDKLQTGAFKTGASANELVEPSGAPAGAIKSVLQNIYDVKLQPPHKSLIASESDAGSLP